MRFIFPVLLLCVVSSFGFSQTSGLRQDAQALALLRECQSAMGAPDSQVQVTATGNIQDTTHEDTPRAFTMKNIGVEQVLWQEEYPDGPLKRVLNGERSFQSYKESKGLVSSFESYFAHPEDMPALACSTSISAKNSNIFYLGKDTLNGISADHIQFNAVTSGTDLASHNARLISNFHVYLDTTTHRVVATKKYAFSPKTISNHSEWLAIYSQYKNIHGI
jgi:hypothetical protein